MYNVWPLALNKYPSHNQMVTIRKYDLCFGKLHWDFSVPYGDSSILCRVAGEERRGASEHHWVMAQDGGGGDLLLTPFILHLNVT